MISSHFSLRGALLPTDNCENFPFQELSTLPVLSGAERRNYQTTYNEQNHSLFKLCTGFTSAALIDCQLTVNQATIIANPPDTAKIHHSIPD